MGKEIEHRQKNGVERERKEKREVRREIRGKKVKKDTGKENEKKTSRKEKKKIKPPPQKKNQKEYTMNKNRIYVLRMSTVILKSRHFKVITIIRTTVMRNILLPLFFMKT